MENATFCVYYIATCTCNLVELVIGAHTCTAQIVLVHVEKDLFVAEFLWLKIVGCNRGGCIIETNLCSHI